MVTQVLKYLFDCHVKPKFAFEFKDAMKIHCLMYCVHCLCT